MDGRLVIVGAGGFGREVIDIVEALEASSPPGSIGLAGVVDDSESTRMLVERRGVTWLGSLTEWIRRPDAEASYVIGIGSGDVRRRLDAELTEAGRIPTTLVHPLASVGGDTRLGAGCILAAGARLTTNITIGRHVDVHVNATIGHDSTFADFVSVYPGATVGGNVQLGEGATVGTGANVLPGITIGARAFVGAGAVVTHDVQPGVTVVGVPARPIATAGAKE